MGICASDVCDADAPHREAGALLPPQPLLIGTLKIRLGLGERMGYEDDFPVVYNHLHLTNNFLEYWGRTHFELYLARDCTCELFRALIAYIRASAAVHIDVTNELVALIRGRRYICRDTCGNSTVGKDDQRVTTYTCRRVGWDHDYLDKLEYFPSLIREVFCNRRVPSETLVRLLSASGTQVLPTAFTSWIPEHCVSCAEPASRPARVQESVVTELTSEAKLKHATGDIVSDVPSLQPPPSYESIMEPRVDTIHTAVLVARCHVLEIQHLEHLEAGSYIGDMDKKSFIAICARFTGDETAKATRLLSKHVKD